MISIKKLATSAGYNTTTGTDLQAEPDKSNRQALSDNLSTYEDLTGEQPAHELIKQYLTAYQWFRTCSHNPCSPVRDGIAWQIGLDTGIYDNTTELLGAVTAHGTGNAVDFCQRSDIPGVVYVQTAAQEKVGVAVPFGVEDLYQLAEVITEILADQGEGEIS